MKSIAPIIILICFQLIKINFAQTEIVEFSRDGIELDRLTVDRANISAELSKPVQIVSRREWRAQPRKHSFGLDLPVPNVIIAQTGSTNCSTKRSCASEVRLIQSFHMKTRGFDDIGFNFLIGGQDGAVYTGAGWNFQGRHTRGYNVNSICIAFIGTFDAIEPTSNQIVAAQKLIEAGIKLGKIQGNYRLYGHDQLMPSINSPSALRKVIQNWDHWTNTI